MSELTWLIGAGLTGFNGFIDAGLSGLMGAKPLLGTLAELYWSGSGLL